MAAENSRAEQQWSAGLSSSGDGVFNELSPAATVRPPYFTNGPDLFTEVEWGSLPNQEDAQKAYTLWSTQDSCLGDENARLRSRPQAKETGGLDAPHACLARNVYENILHSDLLTFKAAKADAQYRYMPETDTYEPWRYGEIFHPDGSAPGSSTDPPSSPILINGHNVLTDRFLTKVRLQAQLRSRHLDPNGLVADLRQRLHDYEKEMKETAVMNKESLLPREDLSDWGISRKDDFMIGISSRGVLKPLDIYTWVIILSPYNPTYWTSRAYLHYQMGYFDLAIGDAYRAQMLCEVLVNPSTRNLQPGLYIRIWDAIEKHLLQIPSSNANRAGVVKLLRGSNGVNCFIPTIRKSIHHIINLSLLRLHCWSDYEAVERHLVERQEMEDRDTEAIIERWHIMKPFIEARQQDQRKDAEEYFYESNYGHVVQRDYPYSAQDVDRTSPEFMNRITEDFIGRSQLVNPEPKIAVAEDDEGNLGVYATQDIEMGEIVYIDEPSIRGHLHGARRNEQTEHHCENCKSKIRKGMPGLDAWVLSAHEFSKAVCDCLGYLRNPYIGAFRRVMRAIVALGQEKPGLLPPLQLVGLGTEASGHHAYLSHTNESHGTLLSLLLREVFDITLQRRKVDDRPNLLAYEIDELMPLFAGKDNYIFPFSFSANIKVPLDILMCLGVNIFRDLTFDTWVIQSVIRKLVPNVVTWDGHRRGPLDLPEKEEIKQSRSHMFGTLGENRSGDLDPTFRDLYIFPGPLLKTMSSYFHTLAVNYRTEMPIGIFQTRCNCPLCAETYGESSDKYTAFPNNHDSPGHPNSPDTESNSASSHRVSLNSGSFNGNRRNHPSRLNTENTYVGGKPSDQDTVDRPENPRRQINADENYEESTGSDSTEMSRKSLGILSPWERSRPKVKWSGEEVSSRTYRRKERERNRNRQLLHQSQLQGGVS